MKLSHFVLSLLAVCAVQAEIILPAGFERIDVTTGTDFKADGSWSFGDNSYVFVLGDDTEWVTSASQNTPMRDGAVYITSDSVAPASFSATGLTNGRILQATAIEGVTKGKTYTWSGLDDVSISQNSVNRNVSISNGTLTSKKYIFGVIGGSHVSQIFSFSRNAGKVSLSGNTASHSTSTASITVCGSAVSAIGRDARIELNNNAGGVSITSNTARMNTTASSGNAQGGALYVYDGKISVQGNSGLVELNANSAENNVSSARGGLAYLYAYSNASTDMGLEVSGNTAGVQINDNTAYSTKNSTSSWLADGGAISCGNQYNVGVKVLDNKGRVSISGNKAITTGAGACGGAMSVGYVELSGNDGWLLIQNNYTEAALSKTPTTANPFLSTLTSKGGAFFVTRDTTSAVHAEAALRIAGNGNVTITGNHADAKAGSAAGGVVYGAGSQSKVEISNNGAVNISGNSAAGEVEARGGAIYTSSGVFIENNESVILAGNYEKSIDAATGAAAYRLRSIYQDNTTTDNSLLADSQFRLMAAKDKVIDIQDSLYSNYKEIDVVFNGDYATSAGETVKGEGTIRFTGQHTREALEKLKGEGAVTDEELAASRTSEFASIVKLMGGRLELVEAVCLKGVGVNVAEGSGAVLALENGSTLQQTGAVTFNAGTTLEVTGTSNTLTAQSLTLADDSTIKFVLTHDALSSAMLTLDVTDGLSADFFNNVTIELAGELTAETGTYHLLSLTGLCDYTPETDWDEKSIRLKGAENARLSWSGGELMVTVLPEPATATLSLLALTLLSARRRRR